MKKLLLLSVSLLIAAVSFSQKIKVTVTEAQRFMKWGQHDYLDVLTNPESIEDKHKNIDCNYTFDLEEKTLMFSNPKHNEKLSIINSEKQGNTYVIECISYGNIDPSFTYHIKIYVDMDLKTMFYTKYDPYMDRSFVTPCKSTIVIQPKSNQ